MAAEADDGPPHAVGVRSALGARYRVARVPQTIDETVALLERIWRSVTQFSELPTVKEYLHRWNTRKVLHPQLMSALAVAENTQDSDQECTLCPKERGLSLEPRTLRDRSVSAINRCPVVWLTRQNGSVEEPDR